jgi:hypothetical protein
MTVGVRSSLNGAFRAYDKKRARKIFSFNIESVPFERVFSAGLRVSILSPPPPLYANDDDV